MATSSMGIRPTKSPIASDPGYEHECSYSHSGSSSYRPRGRTTWAGESIARQQIQGTIARILYPQSDLAPRTARGSYKHDRPKDFMKINARKVNQIQRQCQSQLEAEAAKGPVKGQHLGDKYNHIQPRVTSFVPTPRPQSARPQYKQQQQQQQKTSKQVQTDWEVPQQKKPQSARLYRSSSLGQLDAKKDYITKLAIEPADRLATSSTLPPKKKNFLSQNTKNVVAHKVARPPSVEHLVTLQKRRDRDMEEYRRGVVPTYLKERQTQWIKEAAEKKRNAPDPSIPSGHALMPKEERVKTLGLLQDTHSSLTNELQRMPVRTDTYKLKTRKSELETKLSEIDDAIKIFSRTRVFVKLDD